MLVRTFHSSVGQCFTLNTEELILVAAEIAVAHILMVPSYVPLYHCWIIVLPGNGGVSLVGVESFQAFDEI